MSSLSEVELLRRARAGDARASETLYKKYLLESIPLRALLRKEVSDESERNDLLHEIFLALMKTAEDFKGESKLSTYIYQVARLTLFQKIRRQSAQKRGSAFRIIPEDDAPEAERQHRNPVYEYEQRELRRIVERLIEDLPAAYREATRLSLIEQWEYREIAEKEKVPLNTVATRIHKGKKLLVNWLQKYGNF